MTECYIFDGKNVKPCEDFMTWARWYEKADRGIDETFIGGYRVSTIFLGLNHAFGGGDPGE